MLSRSLNRVNKDFGEGGGVGQVGFSPKPMKYGFLNNDKRRRKGLII